MLFGEKMFDCQTFLNSHNLNTSYMFPIYVHCNTFFYLQIVIFACYCTINEFFLVYHAMLDWGLYICQQHRSSYVYWFSGDRRRLRDSCHYLRMACKNQLLNENGYFNNGNILYDVILDKSPGLSLFQAVFFLILLGWVFLPVYVACGVRRVNSQPFLFVFRSLFFWSRSV